MREFDETYMSTGTELKGSGIVGFGHSNRTPESSRVSKTQRKVKGTAPKVKGLPRSCVSVKRTDRRKWDVYLKASSDQRKIAVLEHHHGGYGFMILIDRTREDAVSGQRSKPHGQYPTLKAATQAMLERL